MSTGARGFAFKEGLGGGLEPEADEMPGLPGGMAFSDVVGNMN